MNHEILLAKLHLYGIQGVSAGWFRSYLNNGRQKVEKKILKATQNFFSDWGKLKCGFSQGLIVGPLLFIIYMNDLSLSINFLSPVLFADDTGVIISSRNFGASV
jgi:hypothetical protein